MVNEQEPQCNEGPSLRQIIADLRALGCGSFAGPVPISDAQMPPDAISQLFPGGDQPLYPVDCLVQIEGARIITNKQLIYAYGLIIIA